MTDTRSAPDRETTDAAPPALSTPAEETSPRAEPAGEAPPPKTIKPTAKVVIAMVVVFLIGVLVVLYAWKLWPFASDDRTTENAYVRGQITAMAPQVNGYVVEVAV
ncbi:MAG: HlyD family secretion protein, partial [Staphylococcus hominis]